MCRSRAKCYRAFRFFKALVATLPFCKHCAIAKVQQPIDLLLSCYDHVYRVLSRFFIFPIPLFETSNIRAILY